MASFQRLMHTLHRFTLRDALDETLPRVDDGPVFTLTPPKHDQRMSPSNRLRYWTPTARVATLSVAAASVAIASATFFTRRLTEIGISPTSVAFYRYAITALVLLRFLRLSGPHRAATFWGLASGATAGLGWAAYASTIESGDLATAGVAYMTFPVFTLIACQVFFSKRASPRAIIASALVVAGAAIALSPNASDLSPLLLAAPATFGFSVAVLTEKLTPLDPFERLSAVAVGAVLVLTPMIVALPADEVMPTEAIGWLLIVGIAVGCALIPMTIYGAVAHIIGAARTAIAGSGELPTMFIIGALFFGETVGPEHLAAGVIIAVAIALTPSARTLHVLPETDQSLTNPL